MAALPDSVRLNAPLAQKLRALDEALDTSIEASVQGVFRFCDSMGIRSGRVTPPPYEYAPPVLSLFRLLASCFSCRRRVVSAEALPLDAFMRTTMEFAIKIRLDIGEWAANYWDSIGQLGQVGDDEMPGIEEFLSGRSAELCRRALERICADYRGCFFFCSRDATSLLLGFGDAQRRGGGGALEAGTARRVFTEPRKEK